MFNPFDHLILVLCLEEGLVENQNMDTGIFNYIPNCFWMWTDFHCGDNGLLFFNIFSEYVYCMYYCNIMHIKVNKLCFEKNIDIKTMYIVEAEM